MNVVESWRYAVRVVAAMAVVTLGTVATQAQSGANVSSQDKQFLQDFAKDSNFEMATSKLALQKSKSQDVRQYASMVEHDHMQLKTEMRTADRAAGVAAAQTTSMTDDEQSMYDKLKGLNGDDFEKAYIQELVKGNSNIDQEEKSESNDSKVPSVKRLAEKAAATDQKHATKAKELAQAHNVQA